MIEAPHLVVLRHLYERLFNQPVSWVITGSLGFALQDVPVKVNDIDLQTDQAGAYQIERLFAEYSLRKVRFSTAERIRSHFGALEIEGVEVEIMGDIEKRLSDQTWSTPVDLKQHRRWIIFEGMHLPVLSLEYEIEAYRQLGRVEKAEMLAKWLLRSA